MKIALVAVAGGALALAGCSTTAINAALQRGAPQACANASTAYSVYVASAPSAKELARVNTFYQGIHDMCLHPSQITVEEAAIVAAQAVAMSKAMKGK
jgi:hypothetical protein